MSKALNATCLGGVVKVGQTIVPQTTILSEGIGSSSGLLVLDEDKKTYIAKISPDLKTTLEKTIAATDKISDAITKISTVLTSIGAFMTGPTTAPPPTLAADVAEIVGLVVEIEAAKTEMTTLKENLK